MGSGEGGGRVSFHPYNLDGLKCAKRLLTWAGASRRMMWREVNLLMASVRERERAFVACITKEAYDTYSLAERIAKRPTREHHGAKKIYKCHVCHKWHIGHVDVERVRAQRLLREKREEREAA